MSSPARDIFSEEALLGRNRPNEQGGLGGVASDPRQPSRARLTTNEIRRRLRDMMATDEHPTSLRVDPATVTRYVDNTRNYFWESPRRHPVTQANFSGYLPAMPETTSWVTTSSFRGGVDTPNPEISPFRTSSEILYHPENLENIRPIQVGRTSQEVNAAFRQQYNEYIQEYFTETANTAITTLDNDSESDDE